MLVFGVLAVVMLVGAIGVVTLKQPVHAALSLVGTLMTLAIAYVQLHAHFLAAIQVIVYAGAIMVLFLFVIMLLNLRGDEPERGLGWIRPAAWVVGALVVGGVAWTVASDPAPAPSSAEIAAAFQGSGVEQVADQLFGRFVLSFHLVGVLLLTGIVAAVGLVQRKATEAEARKHPEVPLPLPPRDAAGVDRAPVSADGGR
jgi:NADH-quinone oxidoreductase subunit J